MSIVIKVEQVSKKFIIGHQEKERYTALRDVMSNKAKKIFSFSRNGSAKKKGYIREEFWALKNINFEIQQGDRVGIIGRNGAGKSTLLKILSRITEPTTGKITMRGRVASLLEVGTGFHPELTGRENIFLNGAILGMSRPEIRSKFDEIVAFAEVEKFLDTPVKRYSSGMYVRLAFAVAAHLEPEILIVDEVLAVGDAQFQQKCLGKMEDVSKNDGRTVLFVSHNMGAITALCQKGILLSKGMVEHNGGINDVISHYLKSQQAAADSALLERTDRSGSGKVRFADIYFSDKAGNRLEQLISGNYTEFRFRYMGTMPLNSPQIKFTIYNRVGQPVTHFDSNLQYRQLEAIPSHGELVCRFEKLPFSAGCYHINVVLVNDGEVLDYVTTAIVFTVISGNFFGNGRNIAGIEDISLHEQNWHFKSLPAESR